MRRIGVVTTSRADYGLYLSVLRAIQEEPGLKLKLYVTGTHLENTFGRTENQIEADGFQIAARVQLKLKSDGPGEIARSIGTGVAGFSRVFAKSCPDILVVLGDRFDMLPAPIAALPFNIPVAHIHGGEITTGAMDDSIRHAITKMSHIHFASTEASAARIRQMGEEPRRVIVSGAPGLDTVTRIPLLDRSALKKKLGIDLMPAPFLVTFHPVTLDYGNTARYTSELLDALGKFDRPLVFTQPNADTHGRVITRKIRAFVKKHPRSVFVSTLGPELYCSLMNIAAVMVGNSSSGILEAPSFSLPVVNIGTRQEGRDRARNVIDSGYESDEIKRAIDEALSPAFVERLIGLGNPYGDGHAAQIIVKHLKDITLGPQLVIKRFSEAVPARAPKWAGGRVEHVTA